MAVVKTGFLPATKENPYACSYKINDEFMVYGEELKKLLDDIAIYLGQHVPISDAERGGTD